MKKQADLQTYIVAGIFLLAAIWYFVPVGKECFAPDVFAMRLALPAAILALGGIGLLPPLMTVGFVFCTIGDAMGVLGSFEGQMGGFAVAQICFITQFVKEIRENGKQHPQRKIRPALPILISIVCLIPLIIAAHYVLPGVKALPIKIGCIIYAVLLVSSVWTSMLRAFTLKKYTAMIGCIIFLTSDFTIAWNKFAEHIPHAGLYIMITYYTALILLYFGTLRQTLRR